jgi:hypothetical protein
MSGNAVFAQALNADDVKWINQCIADNKGGASDAIIRKYCVCMNEKMDNNETRSITQWKRPTRLHALPVTSNRAGDSRSRHSRPRFATAVYLNAESSPSGSAGFCPIGIAATLELERCWRRRSLIDADVLRGIKACDVRAALLSGSSAAPCQISHQDSRSWPSINRSSAVRLSFGRHPFGQCVRATYVVVRPSFCAAKGKTAAEELGEAWQP